MRPFALALVVTALVAAAPALALDKRIVLLNSAGNYGFLDPRWTPTPDQADEALTALMVHLDHLDTEPGLNDEQRRRQGYVQRRIADYRFQAYGVTMGPKNIPGLTGPTRILALNGLCVGERSLKEPAWSQRPLIIMDGGPCHITAYYDLSARRIAWLMVDGMA